MSHIVENAAECAPVLGIEGPPITMYAIVPYDRYGINDAMMVYPFKDKPGEYHMAPADGNEDLYEDCDFDGLHGLVVFEGAEWHKGPDYDAASDEECCAWEDEHGVVFGDYSRYTSGRWRRMTAAEAVALGILEAE